MTSSVNPLGSYLVSSYGMIANGPSVAKSASYDQMAQIIGAVTTLVFLVNNGRLNDAIDQIKTLRQFGEMQIAQTLAQKEGFDPIPVAGFLALAFNSPILHNDPEMKGQLMPLIGLFLELGIYK